MKKKTKLISMAILLSLFVCSKSNAQLNAGIGIGYDAQGQVIAQLSFGYEIGILSLTGEIKPALSRNVSANNYCGGNISLNVLNPASENNYLFIGAGYYYNKKSEDKIILNKYYVGYLVKYIHMTNDHAGLYIEPMYINNSVQITAGMMLKFN